MSTHNTRMASAAAAETDQQKAKRHASEAKVAEHKAENDLIDKQQAAKAADEARAVAAHKRELEREEAAEKREAAAAARKAADVDQQIALLQATQAAKDAPAAGGAAPHVPPPAPESTEQAAALTALTNAVGVLAAQHTAQATRATQDFVPRAIAAAIEEQRITSTNFSGAKLVTNDAATDALAKAMAGARSAATAMGQVRDRLRDQAEGKSAKARAEQKAELIQLLDEATQKGDDTLEATCTFIEKIKVVRKGHYCDDCGHGATHVTARCYKTQMNGHAHMAMGMRAPPGPPHGRGRF